MKKETLINNICENLKIAKELRIYAKPNPDIFQKKMQLKKFQVERLKITHNDFLSNSNTFQATQFFLEELYTFKDLSKRDKDLEKLIPMFSKVFPENTLKVLSDAILLDALTEKLETIMAQNLKIDFSEIEYYETYQKFTTKEDRITQINLVHQLGIDLTQLVKIPLISSTLKMMTLPAKLAKLEDLHNFLYNGFDTFKNTKNPEDFVDLLVKREKELIEVIFSQKKINKLKNK